MICCRGEDLADTTTSRRVAERDIGRGMADLKEPADDGLPTEHEHGPFCAPWPFSFWAGPYGFELK
jgi:hypothetical protein